MRLPIVGLSLAALAAPLPSAEPGLKIAARETYRSTVIETTEYIQTDRTRVDTQVTWRRLPGVQAPHPQDVQHHRSTMIERCDRQKTIVLNYGDRTYSMRPLRIYPTRAQLFLASLRPAPRQSNTPNLLIETTTVDTGDRKTAFGLTARRVVITRRDIPLDADGGAPSQTQSDGWYIDLETQRGCGRLQEGGTRAVLVAYVSSTATRRRAPLNVTFKDVGANESGYPIELTTTTRSSLRSDDGAPNEHAFVTHKVVTQLSREPLDPALFEIPSGFRAAEGRLAALAAPLVEGWANIRELFAALFR